MSNKSLSIVIVGGGAAGFFSAMVCAELFPQHTITILEKSKALLSKVRISGGGRCNVTHSCFDPSLLVKNYPRGHRELRGPFTRFNPLHTVEWFAKRGIELKTEEDGRMFPFTDSSETIIDCFLKEANRLRIKILTHHALQNAEKNEEGKWVLHLGKEEPMLCDRLLIATGSTPSIYSIIEKLGHTVVPLVPSLFTFNCPSSPFLDLSGISVPKVRVRIIKTNQEQIGPLLFTHWGLSGPAVLKLSAWSARELYAMEYKTEIEVNWVPEESEESLKKKISDFKKEFPARFIASDSPVVLPKQLWKRLSECALIPEQLRWRDCSGKMLHSLVSILRSTVFILDGKTTYKQEFVTCGGVSLEEIDFRTMQSRKVPGLFFSGEVLNIDGVTGGFNFQNAWTTGWIAAQAIGL